jgi:hypothetical protein
LAVHAAPWLSAAVATLLPVVGAAPAQGQGTWDADLMIDPFPSPYASDWEANPNIASLTVFNMTGSEGTVRLTFSITDHLGGVLANGSSDPQTLPPGPTEYHSPFDLSGSFDYDVDVQDVIVRTGRIPEGDYTACTAVSSESGFVLAEACSTFSVLYPDPPMLLTPFDGDRITTEDPFFEWTPLQVPVDVPVRFVLQVAKVEPGQTAHQALTSGVPQFQESDLASTSIQYPLGALSFEPGERYAWRVQALGPNGYPVSANDGWSEIWTFSYVDATTGVTAVRISPSADTLVLAGDTTRLEATALDENDFELPDPEVEWTSSDPEAASVDSTGLVTAVGPGHAEIVATAGDIADTASVVARGGGSGLRITFYDPETEETPELYDLLASGTYEEIAETLKDALAAGTFELPLPAPGGLAAAGDDRGTGRGRVAAATTGPRRASGPRAPASSAAAATAECEDVEFPYYAYFDADRRSFAIGMRPPAETAASVLRCLELSELEADRPGQKLEYLFAAAIPEQGAPQASVGIRVPFVGLFENQPGVHFDYAVLVLNLGRGFEMDAAGTLPSGATEVTEFYPYTFEVAGADGGASAGTDGTTGVAGTGPGALTVYGRMNLANTPIVGLLDGLGYQEHAIALRGVVTYGGSASSKEGTSGGTTNRSSIAGRLHLEGKLPRRTPQLGAVARFVNWAQAGVALDVELASEGTDGAADTRETDSASGGTTTRTTVTPRLTHTMELDLPFPNWPPLTLNGSMAWSASDTGPAGGTGDGSGTDSPAAGTDSTSAGSDSTAAGSGSSTWALTYQVSSGEDSTLVLWDFLHLSLGARLAYRQSSSDVPAQGQLELFGTSGFGSTSDGATVRVAYVRESADCGGEGEPACTTPTDASTGPSRPPEPGERQDGGQWELTLEKKSVAFGSMFGDLLQLIEGLR